MIEGQVDSLEVISEHLGDLAELYCGEPVVLDLIAAFREAPTDLATCGHHPAAIDGLAAMLKGDEGD